MTWQDELQNLDAELAAGRISAEEYRQRRDAVLGRAQGQAGPPSGGFPQQQPGTGFPQQAGTPSGGLPQQPNPFPPAFSWGDAAAQGAQRPGAPEESTQIVQNPFAGGAPQPPQVDNSGATQVVNVGQQQPQWPTPQPQWGQQQGWNGAENVGTPWGDDLPGGTPEPGDAPWMRQGPEVFETAGKSGKGKLIAGLSIGVVLLVGLVVAGFFYFNSGGSSTEAQQTPSPPPPAKTKELAEPPAPKDPPASSKDALVTVSGPAHPWSGQLDNASLQGEKGGLLQPKTVLETAIQNGLIDTWFNGTEGATPKTTLLALHLPNADAAKNVVDKYLAAQQGLSTVENLSYKGVKVVSTSSTFRTAYVAHGWAIIIDVSGDQKDTSQQAFQSLLDQQIKHLPPTVRN